ncbi:glucose-6-phosphate isomerase [Methylovirgula sp. 4M-Z18]|uniref:glucose-6-phosphate isomerase n=1 Tax=Methylovirgula sp. 4M-Z18 TaxID=2293567 RepID=UPI000E2F05FB|nr:glucose-6-phosphate isomerase [Methylovirgula sp. 4M-Z18]RFB79511.1 glucose-6-phosphate isomerase [Methylovirgula sp. 4M-Z18]
MSQSAVAQALAALRAHKAEVEKTPLVQLFAENPQRFAQFHARLDDLCFDYSKQRVTAQTLALLQDLAKAAQIEAKRDAMFAGQHFNTTEDRAALHTALRNFSGKPVLVDGQDVMPDVLEVRARVADFATKIRDGVLKGATGKLFTDVVNIGIGGSDLGPAMATKALSPYAHPRIRSHFVSNVDGADIADTLKGLDPASTLFIVASKTFTTLETMTNAHTARAWIVNALGEAAAGDHFAAVSTNLALVAKFGIDASRVFGFWDWVGGRYSLWSSIGLPIVIAIGPENFEHFLRGAYEVDTHFREAPVAQNIPMLMGLIGAWYRNVWGFATQAVIPYDQRMSRFSAYLQQLDMESNGKSVHRDGSPVHESTGPVIWGEPGTNGQHAFFQLLHQGTEVVPIDFLAAAEPTDADQHHHDLLIANVFAQGEALMRGRTKAEVEAILTKQGMAADAIAALAPHKVFPGNRPTSTFLYKKLDPRMLGRLIAFYEHKIFVQAAIWDINPFDQWGVELGKELASRLAPIVADGAASTAALDSSTAGLIGHMRALRS